MAAAGRPLPGNPPGLGTLCPAREDRLWGSRRRPSGLGLEPGLDGGLSSISDTAGSLLLSILAAWSLDHRER